MSNRADARKAAIMGTAGRLVLDALLRTVRFEVRSAPGYAERRRAGEHVAYTLWHGRLLPLAWHNRGRGIATLISLSKDGEYIARVVEGWDFRVVRGSSSRGGQRALAELIRHARAGRSLAITPDGPRGPRQKMKPGILLAAQRARIPVVPATAACTRAWWFEGWDRFLVPKPFSRVVIEFGEPVLLDPALDETGLERAGHAIEQTLNGMQRRLDAEVSGSPAEHDDVGVGREVDA
ncbi:MAG TPA: lysophospholipid acyltransferase family protein [Longimicrobiales bacterium]